MSYRIWTLDAPFDKHGVPVMGSQGRTIRRVVVIEAETFKRLLAEHASLDTVEFEVGAYDDEAT